MKKSDLGDTVIHYIPQMWNDITGKWIDIEPFKKPYTTKAHAIGVIAWRRKRYYEHGLNEKFRIRIETFKVTDVAYEDA